MVKEEDQSNEPPTQSPSLQEQSYVNDRDVVSFPLQHVGKITVIFLSIPSQPFFSFITNCKIVHFVANSNWDEFFNARLPSRGWCIPRRVGSDL